MKIIFTGGKTGGHIIPLIRIIENIKADIYYIGNINSLEERICKTNNITFIGYDYNKKYASYKFLKKKIKEISPDIMISSGGYVAFIPLIIARIYKIDYYLIEENATMGLCNKFFKGKAKKVFLSFPLKKMSKNMIISGNPSGNMNINKYEYSLDKTKINILVIGGSLGSKDLCEIAYNLSLELNDKYKIILISGRYFTDYYMLSSHNLIIYEYIDNLHNLMYHADIIISRAGSSTIFEALKLKKKLILVPSRMVKDDHQYKNSIYIKEHNLGYLLEDNIMDLILDNKDLKRDDIILNSALDIILKEIGYGI
ncbi:MAG: UDP-N-acetylglucosamine--N-acetylmuramyl-(pentapeptide) pyrophosphoryl-undecaprenol N-acetylglucosamine transferase [Anaeroplasmataceae bacterium]